MPPIEKNPADELLKIPFTEALQTVLVTRAMVETMLDNQIQILEILTGKNEVDIREEVMSNTEKHFKKIIDIAPKIV